MKVYSFLEWQSFDRVALSLSLPLSVSLCLSLSLFKPPPPSQTHEGVSIQHKYYRASYLLLPYEEFSKTETPTFVLLCVLCFQAQLLQFLFDFTTAGVKCRVATVNGLPYFTIVQFIVSSRKHAYIILTPLNPTFI